MDEFAAMVPPFEAAFLDSMAAWTLHGRRRQARRYPTSKHCPLPTPEDRLLCMLVSLKHNTMHVLHGRLCGMRQSTATPWMHVFLPVLRNTLRPLGDAPCRRVEAWRQGLREEVPPLLVALTPLEAGQAAPLEAAPLCVMTARNDPSPAPQIRQNTTRARAGRTSGIG